MNEFFYKNILLYTSHQWCGNTEEYFAKHSEKMAAFLLMPRVQNKDNVLRIYERGKLVKEIDISLSENIFLYYALWYIHYIQAIFTHFPRNEKLTVISAHPYPFFFMTVQKMLRRISFVFWVADYYPPLNSILRLFEAMKKFYHKNIDYACYLGDGVNKIMNGKIISSDTKKTIIWGVKPKKLARNFEKAKNTILFVGVVREMVGLEIVYEFLKNNREYNFKVIGVCDRELYEKHKALMKKYNIEKQVYFPNRFFFDSELNDIAKECFVGIALYAIDNTTTIYYADPGKVKAYAEMGLPIIMSKTSSIYPYIKKFSAGLVIDRDSKAFAEAIGKVKTNYKTYTDGLKKFNSYFYFDDYYKKKFSFLEGTT